MCITNKTIYFMVYLGLILENYIRGVKITQDMLNITMISDKFFYSSVFFKYNTICKLTSLMDIVVVDNITLKNRFEITYIFWNMVYEYKIGIKLHNDGFKPIYSLNNFYNSSIWLEREAWDMYGIKFLFHTGLRRILTDYGFKGHPLRKDYPLLGYVDIYYDDSRQIIKYNPIELTQNLRFFTFDNPWYKWYLQ